MNPPPETPCVQSVIPSPLGDLRLLASPSGLAGVWFTTDQRHGPTDEQIHRWKMVSSHPVLDAAASQIEAYFCGDRTSFDLPVDLSCGTPFQQQVWQALRSISAGHTTSYQTLAIGINRPLAARAVGAAVGRNPLSIVVPCHRVLGSGGGLTGYAGGLTRKAALLSLEGVSHPGA